MWCLKASFCRSVGIWDYATVNRKGEIIEEKNTLVCIRWEDGIRQWVNRNNIIEFSRRCYEPN